MDDNHDGCKGGPFIVSVDLLFEMRKEEGQFTCLDMVKCDCVFKLGYVVSCTMLRMLASCFGATD